MRVHYFSAYIILGELGRAREPFISAHALSILKRPKYFWHMEILHLLILQHVEYGLQDKTKNIIVHSVGIYISMIVRL